jgi:8-oxo-dGTP diphosphatase
MYTYNYPRAALTVDAIVFVKEKQSVSVLLIERGAEPFKNQWALPGGFINMNETLEEACKRELFEETGLKADKMTQFKTYDAINRDPRHRTISVVYFTELVQKQPVKGNDDAARAEWFSIRKLPKLAFDHEQILEEFISEKLR